jgi:hypothetical protein
MYYEKAAGQNARSGANVFRADVRRHSPGPSRQAYCASSGARISTATRASLTTKLNLLPGQQASPQQACDCAAGVRQRVVFGRLSRPHHALRCPLSLSRRAAASRPGDQMTALAQKQSRGRRARRLPLRRLDAVATPGSNSRRKSAGCKPNSEVWFRRRCRRPYCSALSGRGRRPPSFLDRWRHDTINGRGSEAIRQDVRRLGGCKVDVGPK